MPGGPTVDKELAERLDGGDNYLKCDTICIQGLMGLQELIKDQDMVYKRGSESCNYKYHE